MEKKRTFSLYMGEKYHFWKYGEGQKYYIFLQILTPVERFTLTSGSGILYFKGLVSSGLWYTFTDSLQVRDHII